MEQLIHCKKPLMVAARILFALCVTLLLLVSLGYQRDGPTPAGVQPITQASIRINGGIWQTLTLPHQFRGLEPGSKLELAATIRPKPDDCVYLQTLYSPAKIYLDGWQVFEFGRAENRPAFLVDPALELHILDLQGHNNPMELRAEFTFPRVAPVLTIYPPLVGSTKELIMERSRQFGIPLIFALSQIVAGLALLLIYLYMRTLKSNSALFLWLGLFSLCTGVWVLGVNEFSYVLLRQNTFLYLTAILGMATFIIPLSRFVRAMVSPRDPRPMILLEYFFYLATLAASLLQLTGLVQLSITESFFHITLPLGVALLLLFTVLEAYRFHNRPAQQMLLPLGVLTVTAALEFANHSFPLYYSYSWLFQIGVLLFLLIMGLKLGIYMRSNANLNQRRQQLEFEQRLMDLQIREQQQHSMILARNEETLRQLRHDLRHQLTVIQDLADPGNQPLQDYLKALTDQIPQSHQTLCENRIVDALLNHYRALCQQQGVEFTAALKIPAQCPTLNSGSLCAVFGNLLENALEACERMPQGKKFIHLTSRMHYDLLTISMENSFSGPIQKRDDRFLSSKRNALGVGLASVQSVAQQTGGDAQFFPEGDVFHSQVYLHI